MLDPVTEIENLTLLNNDVDISNNVSFVIQITIILLFSTMILGFAIKKLMQVIKG